jgi:hypothetical protein
MNTPIQSLRDQAQKSFERDLPRLLHEHPGEWVAYRGERQVACAAHTQEVYETCFRLGLQPDQFVIFEIAPPDEEIAFSPMAFD